MRVVYPNPHPQQRVTALLAALESRELQRLGLAVLLAAGAGWLVVLALLLRHVIFVSNDSLNNYAHVWYVSRRLWHHGRIPMHMPLLEHGEAYAFPYSFVPWLSAALLRPLLGDWVVTLWLALGAVGTLAASFWALPELRRVWPAAAVLLNSALLASLLLGQLPFLWASALLLAAVGAWRRDHFWWAIILGGLAQATHAPIVLPLAGLLVLAWLRWEPRPDRLLVAYGTSLLLAAPAVWFALASPVTLESSFGTIAANFFGTLAERAPVVALPLLLAALQHRRPRLAPAACAAVLALGIATLPLLHTAQAARALDRRPNTSLLAFIASPAFQPGQTYRFLRVGDDKVGMYELIQHGARLDSSFFPESVHHGSFVNADEYAAFLRQRGVDEVLIYQSDTAAYHSNEQQLLGRLTKSQYGGVWAEHQLHTADYDLYVIHHARG